MSIISYFKVKQHTKCLDYGIKRHENHYVFLLLNDEIERATQTYTEIFFERIVVNVFSTEYNCLRCSEVVGIFNGYKGIVYP